MLKLFRKRRINIATVIVAVISMLAVGAYGIKQTIDVVAAVNFEKSLEAFPESYRDSLRALHKEHPNWTFEAVNTGLNWNTVIKNELVLSRNLVPKNIMTLKGVDNGWYKTPTVWKGVGIRGSFDWDNNDWVPFSGGDWVQASTIAVEYIMDPRNWITENNIFMFEQLSYNEDCHTIELLELMMDNTWMDCDYAKVGGTNSTYAEVLIELGKKYNVSPIMLCARLIQEKGRGSYDQIKKQYILKDSLATGLATSDGGKTFHAAGKKETAYYNMFNIQAAGDSAADVINNGGREAMKNGWTSQYKALEGGASKIANSKNNVGQDTLYFQKFSVVNELYLYWNQYMQNLLAPVNEGYSVRATYIENDVLDSPFTFRIPVYNNMPKTACARPASRSTANPNYKLNALTVKSGNTNLQLTPTFYRDEYAYSLTVPYETENVTLSASAIASTSSVTGTGQKTLKVGNNEFKILCRSELGASQYYTVNIERLENTVKSTALTVLKPDSGTFTSAYNKTVKSYSMSVSNSVSKMGFTFTTEDKDVVVKLRYGNKNIECSNGKIEAQSLSVGKNTFYIDVYEKDNTSNKTTYKVDVTRKAATAFDHKKLQINGNYINGFSIGEKVSSVLKSMSVSNGTLKILNSSKKEKKSTDIIATGDYIAVYDADGKVFKQYQAVLYGDVDGDGEVNIFDHTEVKIHCWYAPSLTGAYLEAANVDTSSEGVDIFDMVEIKIYMWYNGTIKQTR